MLNKSIKTTGNRGLFTDGATVGAWCCAGCVPVCARRFFGCFAVKAV
jgi:hypothetical protein